MRPHPHAQHPATAVHELRVAERQPDACRRCGGTHWISAAKESMGRPVVDVDRPRIPCSRCNPDGVLPVEPLPSDRDERRA